MNGVTTGCVKAELDGFARAAMAQLPRLALSDLFWAGLVLWSKGRSFIMILEPLKRFRFRIVEIRLICRYLTMTCLSLKLYSF